jgi:tetratricopeptide (TPR) repeat protein
LTAAHEAFATDNQVDAGTSLLLGLLQMQVKDNRGARDLLAEAAAASPDNPVAWRSLGVAQAQLGDFEAAREAMDRAVALDPWTVTSYYNRGLFHLQMKEFGLAQADLGRAFQLDPQNREVQRLLQVAAAASRASGTDAAVVLASGEGPPAGFEGDPLKLLAELEAEVEAMFDLPDSLRAANPVAEKHFQGLVQRYVQSPSPELRAVLALGYLDRKQYREAQAVLSPGWGVDLNPNEELMLLFVDRQLGEVARAEQVVQQVLGSGSGAGNPLLVAIAVQAMRSGVDPVGEEWHAPGLHGFFGWWRDSRRSYGDGVGVRPSTKADYTLWRRYASDPLFEQAVWGMRETPIQGGNVGATAGGKR